MIKSYNINTELITIKEKYSNVEEHVVTDNDTRTIFASYGKLFQGKRLWNIPNKQKIKEATIVCLDPFLGEESLLASRVCVKNNIPYVTVDCEYDSEISKNALFNVVSKEYRKRVYPNIEDKTLFMKYLNNANGDIIFTSGDDEVMYSIGKELRTFKPYQVKAIDTAGAGDSFRSGIIHGYLKGYSIDKTVAFASLLAAYICQSFPGVINAPTIEALKEFQKKSNFDFEW